MLEKGSVEGGRGHISIRVSELRKIGGEDQRGTSDGHEEDLRTVPTHEI